MIMLLYVKLLRRRNWMDMLTLYQDSDSFYFLPSFRYSITLSIFPQNLDTFPLVHAKISLSKNNCNENRVFVLTGFWVS